MKSSFPKTDKRHSKIELFMPRCGLYYLVFNVRIFFWQNIDNHQYVAKTDKCHFHRVAYSNQPRDGAFRFLQMNSSYDLKCELRCRTILVIFMLSG